MFDLSDRPLVWVPISWKVLRPGEGADALAVEHEVSIDIEVELKDREELIAAFPEVFGEGFPVVDTETPEETRARILKIEVARFLTVVNNWRKFKDKGEPVMFGEAGATKLFNLPNFSNAFRETYLGACSGKVKVREGN